MKLQVVSPCHNVHAYDIGLVAIFADNEATSYRDIGSPASLFDDAIEEAISPNLPLWAAY